MTGLSYSIFMLRCLGLWYPTNCLESIKGKFYIFHTTFVIAIMYSFTLSQIIMLYECINNANEFADASFILLTMITSCGKIFNMIVKREIISKMMEAMQTNFLNTQDEIEITIISQYDRKAK